VNAATKDLARIAASVARDSMARGSRVNANAAQRDSRLPVRAVLHAAMTVGLAVAVAVLAVKLSGERDLRRQAEAQVRGMPVVHAANVGADQQQVGWTFRTALAARIGSSASGATNVATITTAGAPSGSRDRDFQQQLRKQLSDPTLRSAFRSQQRGAVLQLYGELLRSWHLSADKSDRVLDVLAEQQLQEMEQSLNSSDPGSTVAARASTEAAVSANNDELNAVLTDQQRKELQRQQDSLTERLTVSALSDELSLAQMPLTDSQRDQLTRVMVDERKAVPIADVSNFPDNSPDARRALEDWQSALDQRVQSRVATILTSAQQARYEQFMSRQREARNAFASFEVSQADAGASAVSTPSPSVTPPGGP
jgi:hypothetical protein